MPKPLFQTLIEQHLPISFYLQNNVVALAKSLIGKVLVTNFKEGLTAGRIVETEAYNGIVDKASHAYGNRHTARTATMFKQGGITYVYLCYGIHNLFNIVSNEAGIPHAILIRGIEPLYGFDVMQKRTNKQSTDKTITRGPGNLSKAMGITTKHDGLLLSDNEIFIADDGFTINKKNIIATPRIGVDYAKEDALLPYRFIVKGNEYVSGKVK